MRPPRQIRLVATLIILTVFGLYFYFNAGKFRPLLHLNLYLLLLIAGGDILGIFLNGLFTKFILRPFNKRIPLIESFFVSLISSVGNFFAPVGAGFGFRAIYLKRKFGVPYSDYISTLSGNYILVFMVNSFFGLLALFLLRGRQDSRYGVLVSVFAIVFIFSLILSLVKIPLRDKKEQPNKYAGMLIGNLARITDGWSSIVAHRTLMLQLTALTVTNLAVTVLITWTIIHALNLTITFGPLLLFSVLGSLSLFINITPANLGVKEAIYLFSSSVLGYSTAQILSIALVDRGVLFLILLLLWLVSGKLKQRNIVG